MKRITERIGCIGKNLLSSALFTIAFFAMCVGVHAQDKPEVKPEEIYKQATPSIMVLQVTNKDGSAGIGSGFLAIKESYAVTAWHVVKQAKKITAKFSDGEEFTVSGLVDKDEKRDVALIRIKEAGRPLLSFAKGDPAIGSKAYIIGAPEGLEFSLADGLISQIKKMKVRSEEAVKVYQFSCPASHGDSGAPLLDASGNVLGVVSFRIESGQNLNFAMPANDALALDATLPTQSWDAVKSDAPSEEVDVSAVDKNKAMYMFLAKTWMDLLDTRSAFIYLQAEICHRPFGYNRTIPLYIFQIEHSVEADGEQLAAISTADTMLEEDRGAFVTSVDNSLKALSLEMRAIETARQNDGWIVTAKDTQSQAVALMSEALVSSDRLSVLKKQKAFMDALVPDAVELLNTSSSLTLGVYVSMRNPTYLVIAPKNSLAYKLGFRTEDQLNKFEGAPITTLVGFKEALIRSAGKLVKVEVLRGDRSLVRKVRVPFNLK